MTLTQVTGLETRGQSYDLQVETVSRALVREGGESKVVVTLTFTASIQLQTKWSRTGSNGETVILKGMPCYRVIECASERHGADLQWWTRSGSRHPGSLRGQDRVAGHWLPGHSLPDRILASFNLTQTLNTTLSAISPGYDLIYEPGESFEVNAFVPKHIAENFTWSHILGDPERDYNLKLLSCYVDQTSGKVLSSVDYTHDPDMSKFLQGHRWVDHPAAAVMEARVPGQWVDRPAAMVIEAREQRRCWIDHPAAAVMEARVQGRHWVDRPLVR
ncbi:hypothetical protein ACOMHN_030264 [Nucella lapillus]